MQKRFLKFLPVLIPLTAISCINIMSCSDMTNLDSSADSTIITTSTTSTTSYDTSRTLLKIDLSDATNLYIGKTSSSASARSVTDSSENKLFKITEEGESQEVTYTYQAGTETKDEKEAYIPESVIKLSSDFSIICFSSVNYLVNTKTGSCYKYTQEQIPYENSIWTDSDGNFYFSYLGTIYNFLVYKLDITDPTNITLKAMTPKTESIETFGIDKNGNIAYKALSPSGSVLRFRTTSGKFYNLPGDADYNPVFWQGLDGLIYYSIYDYMNNSNSTTMKIEKLNSSPSSAEDLAKVFFTESEEESHYYGYESLLLKAKNKDRTILLGTGFELSQILYEVYNPDTNELREVKLTDIGLSKIITGISSDDYYYFMGKDISSNPIIVKVDPVTYSYETLLDDQNYDLYSISLSGDSIIFNALRMSDGAIVLGKINQDKSIDILNEDLEEQVTVLERIN